MRTFNTHKGYGVLEVLQNLTLDFVEFRNGVRDQWAICEALALFLNLESSLAIHTIPGGRNIIDATFQLIGRLFLTMFARLDCEGRLNVEDLPSLGVVYGHVLSWAHYARTHYNVLRSSARAPISPKSANRWWRPHAFDGTVFAYVLREWDVSDELKLNGRLGIRDAVEAAVAAGHHDLPGRGLDGRYDPDPFNFTSALSRYKKQYGGIPSSAAGVKNSEMAMGGDNLDITTWPEERRKQAHADGKDPLSDGLKEGLIAGKCLCLEEKDGKWVWAFDFE
ncbi:hypothetical protein VTJ04DRAFT_10830 [Mycothermus thermophilus]|uniref:uncharacterized protein n=1 Tax=Humicola insolens TaxID=85995 RepID=UPI0037426973